MSLEGELQSLALPKVLHSLAAQRSSGILTVQGEDDIVAISLLDGAIVAADALNQTVEEGLGEVLQGQDLISAEDFSAAVRDHQGGGSGSLGDLLVSRGLVTRDELLDGLRRQTYRLMLQVLTWRNGEFKFYGGDEVSFEEGFGPITIDELLIRSIDDLGEQGGIAGPVPELESAYRRVPQRTDPRVLGRDGDGTGDGVWISPEQEAVMLKVASQITAASVASDLGLNRYQAQFALYNLLQHDLIEHLGSPKPGAPLELPTLPATDSEPLRAEIFTPPEPGTLDSVTATADDAKIKTASGLVQKWSGPALGSVLALALALTLAFKPGAYLLPFPWQDHQRLSAQRQLRQSLYLKIDRAAKTYFLVEVHYPESLEELVERGMISPSDMSDQAGHELRYSTDDVSYRIVPVVDGRQDPDLATTEAITGDFLLDPQFLRPSSTDVEPLWLIE